MKEENKPKKSRKWENLVIAALGFGVLGNLVFNYYYYNKEINKLENELSTTIKKDSIENASWKRNYEELTKDYVYLKYEYIDTIAGITDEFNLLQKEFIKERENNRLMQNKITNLESNLLNFYEGRIPSLIFPEEVASSPVSDELSNCKNHFEFNKLVEEYDSASLELKKLSYEEVIKKIDNIPFAVSYLSKFTPSNAKTLSFKDIQNIGDSIDCLNYSIAIASILSDNGFAPYIITMNGEKDLGHSTFLYKSDKNGKYGILDINKWACTWPKYDSLEQIINDFEMGFGKKINNWSIIRFNDNSYIIDKKYLKNVVAIHLLNKMKEKRK